jgi:hypothetical protein
MADKKPEPTQKTRPHGIDPETGKPYKPVEIPVPKRKDIDKLLARATKKSQRSA